MATRTDPAHVIMVSARPNGRYLTVTARAMAWADDSSPRNIATDSTWDTDPLAGIVATAQSDVDGPRAYGWRFGLTTDGGDILTAATVNASARTLARVGRALDSLDSSFGQSATFGAYVARIATALGVRIIMRPRNQSTVAHYTDGYWNVYAPGDAVAIIDGLSAEFARESA